MRRLAVLLVGGLLAGATGGAGRADVSQPLVGGAYYGTGCSGGRVDVLRDAVDPTLERSRCSRCTRLD